MPPAIHRGAAGVVPPDDDVLDAAARSPWRRWSRLPPPTRRCGDVPPAKSPSLPLVTVVPLAVPPETRSMPPLLTVVPLAVPPDDTILGAAAAHRRAAGRAARGHILVAAAASPWCRWPCRRRTRTSVPPPFTVVSLAVPPETTSSVPPLLTVVLLAVPPEDTYSVPPLLTVVTAGRAAGRIQYSVPPTCSTVRAARPIAAGRTISVAAAAHRGAAGRAAGGHSDAAVHRGASRSSRRADRVHGVPP